MIGQVPFDPADISTQGRGDKAQLKDVVTQCGIGQRRGYRLNVK
jgi:hypothetical protein